MKSASPTPNAIGIRSVAGVLPPNSLTLQELQHAGLLRSSVESLQGFGFHRAFVSDSSHGVDHLALTAARKALDESGLDPQDIHMLIWAGAIPANHLMPTPPPASHHDRVLVNFQYTAGWLLEELALTSAQCMAVTQQGCSTMFSALRAARSLIVSEPDIQNVLVVGADVLPPDSTREIMYNLISDAGCAAVVSRHCPTDRWTDYHQISRGYYWDTLARQSEIIAAYFPTSAATIRQILDKNDLKPTDIDLVVPTGVSRASWEILLRLVGIPQDRLYVPEHSFGHTVLADNFLMLQEIRRTERIQPGARLLLFTYGFGSAWTALLLEH
jgi:3-oxoacyl-[acyl-carrier-protein] synthase III